MTTKILTGTYTTGYPLKSIYSVVSLTASGVITGSAGLPDNPSHFYSQGESGLTLNYPAKAYNFGAINGGMGGPGADAYLNLATSYYFDAYPGGTGGTGLFAAAGVSVWNDATILGGQGGTGGAGSPIVVRGYDGSSGGNGGVGLFLAGAGSVYNSANHRIQGGAGGTGGYGVELGGDGGTGGAGIDIAALSTVSNHGSLIGGAGGSAGGGGILDGRDGQGGVGAMLNGGTLLNRGYVLGGAGTAPGAHAGAGADVISGLLENDVGSTISGYAGVYVDTGTLTNFGLIDGTGGTAVGFTGAGRLVVEAGATFTGSVTGVLGATIELAENGGTVTGLGGAAAVSGGAVAFGFTSFSTVQLDSGTWALTGGNAMASGRSLWDMAATLANSGTLSSQNGAIRIGGQISNTGTIALVSTGSTTDLRILPAGVTLSGGGKIALSGAKDRILGFSPTSTLTNVDNTIAGTCIFGAANLLTLVNESKGTIDATGGIMTFDTSGSTVTNAGLMESTTGGLLAVTSTTINQSSGGTIDAAGGMINLTGGSDIIGGVIASTTGWAVRALTGANMLDGTTSTVNLTGTLQVFGGDTLTVVGTINNTGKLNLYGGTVVIGAGGATLLGNGQVNFTASAANAITATAAGATLTNAGNVTFGSGTIGGGTLSLVNQAAGVISNGLSVALTINTGSNTVINAGAIAATAAGGGVTVQSAVNNTGRLIANAGGTLTMNGAVTGAGIGQINGGELIIAQAFAENVFFLGKGVLELEDSTAYTGKIVGLSNSGTNSLDLTDITFTSGVTKATYSGTTASGTLTVTDGTHTAHIQLVGNYVTSGFTISSDGHGGTTVIDPTSSSPTALTQAMATFQMGTAANPTGPSPGAPTNLPLIAAHG